MCYKFLQCTVFFVCYLNEQGFPAPPEGVLQVDPLNK